MVDNLLPTRLRKNNDHQAEVDTRWTTEMTGLHTYILRQLV